MSLYDEMSDLREVARTSSSIALRGRWRKGGVALDVIIKQLRPDAADQQTVSQWEHEYRVLKMLGGRGAPLPHGLVSEQGLPHLVMADSHGVALREVMERSDSSIERLLVIATKIADALQRIHEHGIIHQDITPDNLVVFGPHDDVQLIDFRCSSMLAVEDPGAQKVGLRRGTPTYMSPEQTGHTNRLLDSRSDLYSLGVTLYEAFVGVPPFQTHDLLEVIHAHLAKQPTAPDEIKPELPAELSLILLKLLAKSSEERYQTAFGLKKDLERCLARYESDATFSSFELGLEDDRSRMRLPQKLYGRETEVRTLLDAFGRVREGGVETLFIAGHSGIGKTSLVNEVQRPIVEARGHFISGKFDQFNRDIPYQALLEAVRGLIRQVIVADAATVAQFRESVTAALDGNGRVLLDVLPDLELVLNEQPVVAVLDPPQARERFRATFSAMLCACATKDLPLVIFLDDVQWADPPTLDLIRALTTASSAGHLLLLLSYRDNEVFDGHPIRGLIADLYEAEAAVHRVTLDSLEPRDVTSFVADALSMSRSAVKGLANLCETKTSGNPFFLGQLLLSLDRDRLINYDPEAGCFRWELTEIERAPLSDNVVDLMLGKLRDLPTETQDAIRLAACLGNKFDLKRLTLLTKQTPRETAKALWPAMTERYVLPEDDTYRFAELEAAEVSPGYRFAHDRLQQAAYGLINESERAMIHRSVGWSLLRGVDEDQRDELLFDIVGHFEVARELIVDSDEKRELVELSLSAFEKAKRANAFSAALKHVTFAIELLGDEVWDSAPELILQATLDRAICEHLCGNAEGADRLFRLALSRANTPLQRARVRSEMELLFLSVGQHERVIESVVTALRELGYEVPPVDDPEQIRAAAAQLRDRGTVLLGDRTIEELLHLEEASDPAAIQAHEHLSHLAPSAFFRNMELYLWLGAQNFALAVEKGNTPKTPFNFSVSGLANLVRGQLDVAYDLGRLGVVVSDHYDSYTNRATCHFHFCLINSWKHHYRIDEEHAKRAYAFAIEGWNHTYISWSAYAHIRALTLMGTPLFKVRDLVQEYVPVVARTNRENAAFLIAAERMASCLSGETHNGLSYDSDEFDEQKFVLEACAYENPAPAFNYFIFKLKALYILGYHSEAFALLETAERFESPQWVEVTEYYFVRGLIMATESNHASLEERASRLEDLRRQCGRLEAFAKQNPENFECRHQLLLGELARTQGYFWEALEHYEVATRSAAANQFLQVEAMTAEAQARFWLAQHRPRYAREHFQKAIHCYRRWGATRKVDQLIEESQQYWGQEMALMMNPRSEGAGADIDAIRPRIEISSVIRASQAISTEIVLEKLLDRMMTVVSECAGATRGLLLLPDEESWTIGAEWTVSSGAASRERKVSLDDFERIAQSAIRYVERTRQPLCVDAASDDSRFEHDPHVQSTDQRSILCIPVQQQGRIVTILYLENELVDGAFSEDHIEVLRMLSSQIAISIEHANVYSEMEERVAARTLELKESNDRLKTVFDNVAQGLLLVDLEGNLNGEYPPILKRWFPAGVPTALSGFFDADKESQEMFEIGWEQVIDGFLPLEVCVEQLPREVSVNQGRILEFSYRPILDGRQEMRSMLVVVSDVTVERANAKAEIKQRQLMTIFAHVTKDPAGVQEFLGESEQMIEEILRGISGSEVDRRLVHTLKGNTALYGLEEISSLCHDLERELSEAKRGLHQQERMQLAEEWLRARLDIERFVKQGSGAIRVPVEEYQGLLSEMRAARDEFAEDLSLWTLESDQSRFERIAGQMVQLAERLGKSPVQVEIETDGVYFPEIWRGFFASLVHVIRNAVDHGLETADERRSSGKSQAHLTLRSSVSASGEFVLEVKDDGRGIDWTTIRDKASERGLPCETQNDLIKALFSDGFSTRDVATLVSGRGVGLTAVRVACDELRGRIEVESTLGEGTCWRFIFPEKLVRRSRRAPVAVKR